MLKKNWNLTKYSDNYSEKIEVHGNTMEVM